MERLGKFYDFLLCAFANTLAANHGIKTRFSPWWSIPDDLLQVSEHQPVLLVRADNARQAYLAVYLAEEAEHAAGEFPENTNYFFRNYFFRIEPDRPPLRDEKR
jgi:hypothetical protein